MSTKSVLLFVFIFQFGGIFAITEIVDLFFWLLQLLIAGGIPAFLSNGIPSIISGNLPFLTSGPVPQLTGDVLAKLPIANMPSILGPCANFLPVAIPDDELTGTWYVFKQSSASKQAIYSCATLTLSPPVDNTGNLNTTIAGYSIDRTNSAGFDGTYANFGDRKLRYTSTDPTYLAVITDVAYLKGVGFASVACPINPFCCGSFALSVYMRSVTPSPYDIQTLLNQAADNMVPIVGLVDINQAGCPSPPKVNTLPIAM